MAVLLMLALSACDSGELERLRAENEELQTQVSALEEKNTALREKLKELEKPKITESERDDNPIDQFYRSLEVDGCTASMNAQNESWADAWEAEARGLADQLKSHLPLQEDRDLVDGYPAGADHGNLPHRGPGALPGGAVSRIRDPADDLDPRTADQSLAGRVLSAPLVSAGGLGRPLSL